MKTTTIILVCAIVLSIGYIYSCVFFRMPDNVRMIVPNSVYSIACNSVNGESFEDNSCKINKPVRITAYNGLNKGIVIDINNSSYGFEFAGNPGFFMGDY